MIPLHKLERIILEYLNKHDNRDLNEIAKNTNILIDQARRAGEWLKSRNLIEIQKTEDIKIYIENNNDQEFKIVLPERKLIEYLEKNNFNSTINEINKLFNNNPKEVSAAIGYAKKNNWININKNNIIKNKIINDYVTNLLSKGDGSVFEHVNYGFIVTGVSRSLTHELVRHRAGFAFSQRSQRFVDEKEAAFVVPPALTDEREATDKGIEILKDSLNRASESYQALVAELDKALPEGDFPIWSDRRKAIRQAARAVLPNATETKMFVTANVRAWRHFIEMRGAAYADWEIRKLALKILCILQEEAPLLFSDFVIKDLPDQTQIATPRYPKV